MGEREAAKRTWQEAERVIASIQDSDTQARALSSLASSLAQGQQWHKAERVIASIQDSYWQAEALSSLASSLAQAHEWETLLARIQRFWKSAKTQREALSRFPLALNFFSTTPLLGKRFHEAFVWVDTFLRS